MKRLAIVCILTLSFVYLNAQKSKVQSALNYIRYDELDKAVEAIELAKEHHKTIDWAKTWYVSGQVYHVLHETEDSTYKNLHPNPLKEAMDSYLKCMKLDDKNRYLVDIISRLNTASIQFMNSGIEDFNAGDFKGAYDNFENSLKISELPEFDKIDTLVLFNAAIAADRGKMYDVALEKYQQVADLKYGGSKIYNFMANIYKEKADTAQYLQTIKNGIEAYPEENDALMVELINFYLSTNKSKEALEYLNIAIEKDPGNQTYYFAKGTLHDQLEETELAEEAYKKAIELDPDYFDALLNLGAIYYNKAGDIIKAANDNLELSNEEYEAEKKRAYDQFEVALPYLEKAHAIDTTHVETMISLKEMYYRLKMMDKYDDIKAQLEAVKGQ